MVRFTHILHPTDLSAAAAPGLGYATAIARWYQAHLTVLHVVPTFDAQPVPPAAFGEAEQIVFPPSRDVVLEEMRRVVADDTLSDIRHELSVAEGDPAPVILDRALTLRADLVVLGTHGRRGFDRLIHGSVAERVVQRAPCPVLMIPPHAGPAPSEPIFKRILCPIDFSAASEQALGFALDLASQSNGAVTTIHVVDWMAEDPLTTTSEFDIAGYQEQLATEARRKLTALAEAEPHPWCEVEPIVASGRSHREILRYAADTSADLIVMGTHGRGGVNLFGSTTHQVVRAATCPVLVVRG